jgi:hypothetical protein
MQSCGRPFGAASQKPGQLDIGLARTPTADDDKGMPDGVYDVDPSSHSFTVSIGKISQSKPTCGNIMVQDIPKNYKITQSTRHKHSFKHMFSKIKYGELLSLSKSDKGSL